MVKKLKPNQLNISSNQNVNGLRACASTGRNDGGLILILASEQQC